mmetsp:Transcript_104179/g.185055  ORF Transcript_104179/g.185055 Transcript_104179/m.185055 type:complete len:478 (-) Transcript_104179:135-1568(-)|eukprot:CAMPEP_0197662756 /NCGR_PEP_ID=MMETSP1338-20131121/54640_1 /TAXON_ID=43686 ORGANISM="Pelagodinium beii, Strain RCC1491" /NCGR_SAMPLE_ID=MMETSP1338 /ASSEMBLY_ACC=CAM_ASM_000754 /LENGTH=477 /DNA_ID=CAMNT_0043240739 /DNA_START=86 /DNA_END=1519 /DNA_ORIENTATION=+
MALVKALRDKEPAIFHSPSNESLFTDLTKVLVADPKIISKTIAFRIPAERDEIHRILGHLPMIRKVRKQRASSKSQAKRAETPKPDEAQPMSARDSSKQKSTKPAENTGGGVVAQGKAAALTPRPPPKGTSKEARPKPQASATPRNAWGDAEKAAVAKAVEAARQSTTPRADAPRSATPQPFARVATPLPQRSSTPQPVRSANMTVAEPVTEPELPASPKQARTPLPEARPASRLEIAGPTSAAVAEPVTERELPASPKKAQTPRPASHQEARPASRVEVAGPTTPAAEAASSPNRSEGRKEAWYQTAAKTAAGGARLGFAGMPLDDEVPRVDEQAVQEMNQRQLNKLAEVGIDPEGLTATQILQLLYARGVGTSYARANKEAQKKLLIRVKTPVVFSGVLSKQALTEVKHARDLPATEIHDCLDKWEIDALAEVCRSAKHFDEAHAGLASSYTRQFGGRRYLDKIDRRKYVRPPTP